MKDLGYEISEISEEMKLSSNKVNKILNDPFDSRKVQKISRIKENYMLKNLNSIVVDSRNLNIGQHILVKQYNLDDDDKRKLYINEWVIREKYKNCILLIKVIHNEINESLKWTPNYNDLNRLILKIIQ